MRTAVQMIVVALLSAWTAVFLYRHQERNTAQLTLAGSQEGEARYIRLVDKLFDRRSNASWIAAAPTHFTTAAEIATPAVVNVRALIEAERGYWGRTLTNSSGSGVILSPDGYIATNHHVIENSRSIKVTLADKRVFEARVVGSDPSTDIALLKIDAIDLPFLLFGNSDSVRVGEWVLAVGNPFNLESTVTAGIVSAKGRNINILGGPASIESFIQTDAAVNPGNSGGALVNTLGELIGINTAIVTESGSYEGYSFAIPSNLVQKVVRDLREFGEVHRAFLGIHIEDLDSEVARDLGLPNAEGVRITRVNPHSAAADAGLRVDDVILSINNVAIRRTPELQEYIGRMRPGERIAIEYWRNGMRRRTYAMLKDRNNSTASIPRATGLEFVQDLGFELRELTAEERQRLRIKGAMVVSVRKGSIVYETNMVPGYVITSVNGNRVSNLAETVDCIRNAYSLVVLDGYYEGEPDLYSYRFRKEPKR
ncbi:MAG: trypsin-like peptidase domain-containing protein [Saprospiraceae bacterium]|nr:trypsin-like peptidase domain-containing protein [Saprospiraceae bacterium]MDW8483638.1 trypsin-like peptidase domain-containing protein [Saprospiraceae bacterium]